MKLELFHGESYEKCIPVYRMNGDKKEKMEGDISITFSILKNGKVEYTSELEKEDEGFCLELDEETINMLDSGEYTGVMRVKIGNKTQRKEFDIVISD